MGKACTHSKQNRDLLVHATNAGLILGLAERKNRLPTEATLRAIAKSNTKSIALTKQAFDLRSTHLSHNEVSEGMVGILGFLMRLVLPVLCPRCNPQSTDILTTLDSSYASLLSDHIVPRIGPLILSFSALN